MIKKVSFWFYFLYYGAMSAFMPFLVLFYQELNFSGTQIGILTGIAPLITIVGAPLWTGIADTRHRHKQVMNLAILVGMVTGIVFPLLRTALIVMMVYSLFSFFTSPIISLGDSATIAALGAEKSKYGRIRLGGTIGWGVIGPLIGLLVASYGLRMSFWSYAALMLVLLLISQELVFPARSDSGSLFKGMQHFIKSHRWVFFLTLAVIAGMGFSVINNYLFPYMKSFGATESIMGLSLTISVLAEIPVLFFAHVFIRRIGTQRVLHLAVFLTVLRMLLMVVFDSVLGILFAQLLNGLNFPLFWAAGVSFADENSPAGTKSMALGLFSAMVVGFGFALGGLLGGILLEAIGGRWMFLVMSLLTLVGLLTIMLFQALWKKRAPVPV